LRDNEGKLEKKIKDGIIEAGMMFNQVIDPFEEFDDQINADKRKNDREKLLEKFFSQIVFYDFQEIPRYSIVF